MPFLYQFEVRDSEIEGKGVFALEDIPQGAVYWKFQCENGVPVQGYPARANRAFTREQLEAVTEEIQAILLGGIHLFQFDIFIGFQDGSQFSNHSETSANVHTVYPQSKDYREIQAVTTRPIQKGQEMLECYYEHSSSLPQWLNVLIAKHCPERATFTAELEQKQSTNKNP